MTEFGGKLLGDEGIGGDDAVATNHELALVTNDRDRMSDPAALLDANCTAGPKALFLYGLDKVIERVIVVLKKNVTANDDVTLDVNAILCGNDVPRTDETTIIDDDSGTGFAFRYIKGVDPGVLSNHDRIANFDRRRHAPIKSRRVVDR